MTIKRPSEVPEAVKREMEDVIARVRGPAVRDILWEVLENTVSTDSDRRWLKRNAKDEKWAKLDAVTIGMKLRGVSYVRAVLDVAVECDLLPRRKYRCLLRKIGLDKEREDTPLDVIRAIQEVKLVLVEVPRSAHWQGKVIFEDSPLSDKIWTYFWRLAKAAQRGAAITIADFEVSAKRHHLSLWKHRLIKKTPGFPKKLGALIKSERSEHRLFLPPDSIRTFPHAQR